MLKGKELTRGVGWGVELVTGTGEGGVEEFFDVLGWKGGGRSCERKRG